MYVCVEEEHLVNLRAALSGKADKAAAHFFMFVNRENKKIGNTLFQEC